MKKIFASLVAASLMLLGTQAFAQVVPGAGYLYSAESSTSGNSATDAKPLHGFYFGASYNIPIVGGLGIAPGLYANMLFRYENTSAGTTNLGLVLQGSYRELAVNVPVNLNYKHEFGNCAFMVFAGPTFQYGIISKTTVTGSLTLLGRSYSDGSSVNHYDSQDGTRNPFNIYLGGGVGFQVGDILFTVGYDHSLMDVDKLDNVKTGRSQVKAGISLGF